MLFEGISIRRTCFTNRKKILSSILILLSLVITTIVMAETKPDFNIFKKLLNGTVRLTEYRPLNEIYQYPLAVDMLDVVQKVKVGRKQVPSEINNVSKYKWSVENKHRCHEMFTKRKGTADGEQINVLLLVKSDVINFERRQRLRHSWANENYWPKQVNNKTFHVTYIFILAQMSRPCGQKDDLCTSRQDMLRHELRHRDIIQKDFIDHYFNNTYKMMSAFDWSRINCPQAHFYLFIDDDFKLWTRNILRTLPNIESRFYRRFVLGRNYPFAVPIRNKMLKFSASLKLRERSKWFVNFKEYPFEHYPSYVAAGFFCLSRPVLMDVAIAMKFTKYLRFDDVFLGLVLRKLLLVPLHHNGIVTDSDQLEKMQKEDPQNKSMLALHVF